jgi:hypothetical protein
MDKRKQARLVAVALALAASAVFAQQTPPSTVPPDGISDIGSFEQVPYRLEPQLTLRTEDKLVLRKMEDKHIGELRAIEDRFDRELRALRAKQQIERETAIKSFAAKR